MGPRAGRRGAAAAGRGAAAQPDRPDRYVVQAAVAACHALAPTWAETDWAAIASLVRRAAHRGPRPRRAAQPGRRRSASATGRPPGWPWSTPSTGLEAYAWWHADPGGAAAAAWAARTRPSRPSAPRPPSPSTTPSAASSAEAVVSGRAVVRDVPHRPARAAGAKRSRTTPQPPVVPTFRRRHAVGGLRGVWDFRGRGAHWGGAHGRARLGPARGRPGLATGAG